MKHLEGGSVRRQALRPEPVSQRGVLDVVDAGRVVRDDEAEAFDRKRRGRGEQRVLIEVAGAESDRLAADTAWIGVGLRERTLFDTDLREEPVALEAPAVLRGSQLAESVSMLAEGP